MTQTWKHMISTGTMGLSINNKYDNPWKCILILLNFIPNLYYVIDITYDITIYILKVLNSAIL